MSPRNRHPFLLLALGALLLAFPALADGTEKKEAAPPGFDPAAVTRDVVGSATFTWSRSSPAIRRRHPLSTFATRAACFST